MNNVDSHDTATNLQLQNIELATVVMRAEQAVQNNNAVLTLAQQLSTSNQLLADFIRVSKSIAANPVKQD